MHRMTHLFWGRPSPAGRRPRAPRVAALTLALALAILPGAVLAQAQRTVLTGTDQRFFGAPARVWVADGLTQVRGIPQTGTFAFSGAGVTLAGTENDLVNGTLDAGGNGHAWGMVSFTDTASGVTCSGISQGEITHGLAVNSVVAHCSDGAVLKGTLRDTEAYPAGQAPPTWVKSTFTGVLLSPGKDEG
ncbi:MAG: hypothetical protein ACR2JY_14515 [Chloroflexota bacterium]